MHSESESFAKEKGQVQQHIDSIPVHPGRNIDLVMSFSQAINNRVMASASTTSRSSDSLRNRVASTFGIVLETAQRTLKATTQVVLRNVTHPNHRRFRTEVA